MTTTELAEQPQRKQRTITVTGKVRTAIEAMVWEGLAMDEAARNANCTTRAIRKALEKPHVLAFIKHQREVLRTSVCGQNIHALAAVRDQVDNQMARVQAVKALEQLGDDPQANAQRVQAPGIVIMVGAPAAQPVTIEAVPLDGSKG